MNALEDILEEVVDNCKEEDIDCELMISMRDLPTERKKKVVENSFQYIVWQSSADSVDEEKHQFQLKHTQTSHNRLLTDEPVSKIGWMMAEIAVKHLDLRGIDRDYSVIVSALANDSTTSRDVCERLCSTIEYLIP